MRLQADLWVARRLRFMCVDGNGACEIPDFILVSTAGFVVAHNNKCL